MNVTISGRNLTLDAGLRKLVETKVQSIAAGTPLKLISADVVLGLEKERRFKVEMSVAVKGGQYSATATGFDLPKGLDETAVSIRTRLERLLDRLQEHRAEPLREATSTDIAAVRL